jgi:ABC-type sugar transport system substrate-binding protein
MALSSELGAGLCITGPADTWSAKNRLEGLTEVLGSGRRLTVLAGDWTSEGARLVVDAWLEANGRANPLQIVVAQNDDMAIGTLQALRDAATRWATPMANVPITGCDGSPRFGQRLVREGRLACTVAVSSAAGPALDWIRRARAGADHPPAHLVLPVVSYPPVEELARRIAASTA